MPNSSSAWAGASNSGISASALESVMVIAVAALRYWSRLNQRITRNHHHGLTWSDSVRLTSRIIASVPLNLPAEYRVGELSLDHDPDLGAWVVMNGKKRPGHDCYSAEGQFGICDGDRRGPAQDLASDG